MYVINHTEATLNEWKASRNKLKLNTNRKVAKAAGRNAGGPQPAASNPAPKRTIEVSDKVRTALATNLSVSEEDINKIISAYQEY